MRLAPAPLSVPLLFLAALAAAVVVTPGCKHTVGPGGEGEGEGGTEGEGAGGEGEGEGGCPADPVSGLIVPVIDNCTHFNVCGAAVTITDSASAVTTTLLQTGTTAADCGYSGADDLPGTYELNVTAAGYQPFSFPSVTVLADDCGHAIPHIVTVNLTPSAGCG